MNRKIFEWIGLTISILILALSIFFMVNRFSDEPKGVLQNYEEHIELEYADMNVNHAYLQAIMDTYQNNDGLHDELFPNLKSTSKNTEEPYSADISSLLGIDELDEVTSFIGPYYNRSDVFGTGTGLSILNVEKTDTYRYQAALSKSSAVPSVGAFWWILTDIDGNELFRYDDFEHSFQGEIELRPGSYFLYYDFDELPEGIDLKLIWN